MSAPKVVKIKLDKLKPHPRQAAMFGDLPDAELKALAANIKKNGLKHPIEVLPDHTIVTGHQRVRAAGLLKRTDIDAIVLKDLGKLGDGAVEIHFIHDNFQRRQLTRLGKARCISRLMELREDPDTSARETGEWGKLKKSIAAKIHRSECSVNRNLRVLKTPTGVQEAFDRGEIGLEDAGKIAGLPRADQMALDRRLRAEEPAKALAAEHLKTAPSSSGEIDRDDYPVTAEATVSFARFAKLLHRELPVLWDSFMSADPAAISAASGTLRETRNLPARVC